MRHVLQLITMHWKNRELARDRQRPAKSQQGFSLVEMILAMGLFAIFMFIITDIFAAAADVYKESATVSPVSQDGKFILARLSYDIQRASAITTPASMGGSGSTLTMTIGGNTYTYSWLSGNLRLSYPTLNVLNSSETTITSFNVRRIGNAGGKDTIKIDLTVQSVGRDDQGVAVQTFTTTVGRR